MPAMRKVTIFLGLLFSCTNVLAECSCANQICVPNVYLNPSRRFIDVMVINDTKCHINIGPDIKLFRDIFLLFKLNDAEVEIRKIADHFIFDDAVKLSPGSFVGERISYASLSNYFDLKVGCYDVTVKYSYDSDGSDSGFRIIESDMVHLCLEMDKKNSEALVARERCLVRPVRARYR